MQSTNSTSSYYREHTREQDGWTVLASPPAAELPPPYTAEDHSTPASAPVAPAVTLPFEIQTNSNIIGAVPIIQTRKWSKTAMQRQTELFAEHRAQPVFILFWQAFTRTVVLGSFLNRLTWEYAQLLRTENTEGMASCDFFCAPRVHLLGEFAQFLIQWT
ncbi:hypothetical protein C8R44DRAFT_745063 [Mycena epipterygia]|nr:hypothetical protein C8R44DRAFT_745063 [Mycena epipterygia]